MKMSIKYLGQSVFGLSYILYIAGVASDHVDQIGALARNVMLARIDFNRGVAGEGNTLVNMWAKLAFGVGAQLLLLLKCRQKSLLALGFCAPACGFVQSLNAALFFFFFCFCFCCWRYGWRIDSCGVVVAL